MCTRTDCCLLLYLNMSTYEYYWCCLCCCTYRVVPYDPSLVVASFVASPSRSCCWAESSNGWTMMGVFAFFAPLSFFLLACRFFCFSLAPLVSPRLYLTVSMHSTRQRLRGLLLLLYLWPPTRAAAAVCTYDLQHSPPWLLLLSFIVNRLLIVYHAVLLLCHSYHPAHAFVWA